MGRPSTYTPELGAAICERIALGESLRKICRDDGMPPESTVRSWALSDEDFSRRCARAREQQADVMAERVMETADDVAGGKIDPHAGKVVLSALQWTASKLNPKRYAEKLDIDARAEVRHYLAEVPAVAASTESWLSASSSGERSPDRNPTS